MTHRSRARQAGRRPPFAVAAALAAALAWAAAAAAQMATVSPRVPPLEAMTLDQAGRFEVTRAGERIGTEEYRRYRTPTADTLVIASTVRYELPGSENEFQKRTTLLLRAVDAYPILYQSHELVDGGTRALSVFVRDTLVTIFLESEGRGVAETLGIQPGRLAIMDPSVYQHVEQLAAGFASRGLQHRTQHVLVPSQKTVLELNLARRDDERLRLPDGETVEATRVDVFDDLTLFQVWLDDEGRMLRLDAPSHRVSVRRLPPSDDDGEVEARKAEARASHE